MVSLVRKDGITEKEKLIDSISMSNKKKLPWAIKVKSLFTHGIVKICP